MRIAKIGVVGAGTMGSGIAALAASAGVPVVLLDIPGPDGDRGAPARKGLERALKAQPAAFMDPDRAGLITLGNTEDALELLADCDWSSRRSSSSPARSRRCSRGSSRSSARHAIVATQHVRHPDVACSPRDAASRSGGASSACTSSIRRATCTCWRSSRRPRPSPRCSTRARRSASGCSARAIVSRKDVPGFIANRLGVYGMVPRRCG